MDKSIYAAPQGIADMEDPNAEAVQVEVLDDVTGEVVDSYGEDAEAPVQYGHDDNLAEYLDESKVNTVSSELLTDIRNDLNTRKEWEDTLIQGMALLGMRYEEMTEPWDGACGVYHPVIGEATVRFQSETVMETFPAAGPVKTQILGVQTPEKVEAAARVKEDMNYQLTEVMPEYRNEHERMLFTLAPMGCAFKKVYYDPSKGRPVSLFVPPEDIILPYGATNLQSAPRVTHRMRKTRNDLLKLMDAGFYKQIDLSDPVVRSDEVKEAKDAEVGVEEQTPELYTLYESHVELVLEEEGDGDERMAIARPYIFTILEDQDAVLSIRRNWLEDDEFKTARQHFVKYDYIPGFGAYGFGLIHLVGGFAKSATSILRQLVDAGTQSNLTGGFKAAGARIKNEEEPVSPGEYRDVDVPSGTLKDNIVPFPTKEPSAVLSALLSAIIEDARRFASTADLDVSDMSAQAPVGTTMALLERMLKVMSAVQARVHYSFKQELKLLAAIIRDYAPTEYDYDPETGDRTARQADYKMVEIIPVSDPNAATMSQRIVMWQAVMQLAAQAPGIYNQKELHRAVLEVFGVPNINKLIPPDAPPQPTDPVTENMNIINGKPVGAGLAQDHDSHLMVHKNLLVDPLIAAQIGQSPNAQMITGALMAHINEHVAFQYRAKLEQALGVPLPPPEQPLPPEIEVQLAPLIAEASKMLLAQNQIAAQQEQEQAAATDPVLAMQKEELAIKRDKIEKDFKTAQDRLALERDQLNVKAHTEGMKLGVDLTKAKAQSKQTDTQHRRGVVVDLYKTERQASQADTQHKRTTATDLYKTDRQAADRAEQFRQKSAADKKAKAAPKKADE